MKDAINDLIEIAEQRTASDDSEFAIEDYCGGNISDAFDMGVERGEVMLARRLLNSLDITYTIEDE